MNPLDQLADIATPASISLWPLAWGYWLLIVLLCGLLIGFAVSLFWFRNKRQEKYIAVAALANINAQTPYFAHKVQVVMKTLCAHYLPHAASTTLYGSAWQTLLLSVYTGNQPTELEHAIMTLQKRLYTADDENAPGNVNSDSENQKRTNIEQNQQVLIAMKNLVNTSFPPAKHNAAPVACEGESLSKQKATHV